MATLYLHCWLKALEEDNISAVIMLDMSAAFDVVDSEILLGKLKLFGLQDCFHSWVKSYLEGRSQRVYVDGALSDPLQLEAGVPQGSILGPLFYIIFTSDLPEVVHDHDLPSEHLENDPDLFIDNPTFNINCKSCGNICCFADDSSYTKSGNDPDKLKSDIAIKYRQISNYMSRNKLVLNSDKTHLLIMTTSYQHQKHQDFNITLDTGDEIVKPIFAEKLLGGFVSNNLKWNEHIRDNRKSLFNQLNSRINALNKVSSILSFKTRKMIANGIVISPLIYLIQLWGGTPDYLLQILQILQNRAARIVTRLDWNTPTVTLLKQCGWMSVKQLIEYHSLVLVFKIRSEQKPVYLSNKLCQTFSYSTRLATENGIRQSNRIKHDVMKHSFVPRSTRSWNLLPSEIRQSRNVNIFKRKLEAWIASNISIS